MQGPARLGLTQMFAGTMADDDDSQSQFLDLDGNAVIGPTPSIMPDFDHHVLGACEPMVLGSQPAPPSPPPRSSRHRRRPT